MTSQRPVTLDLSEAATELRRVRAERDALWATAKHVVDLTNRGGTSLMVGGAIRVLGDLVKRMPAPEVGHEQRGDAMTRLPAGQRPGQPEAPVWQALAFLAILVGTSTVAGALVIGVAWLVWAYTLVMVSILSGLTAAALVALLACKRDWRPRVTAIALLCTLVALVCWAVL